MVERSVERSELHQGYSSTTIAVLAAGCVLSALLAFNASLIELVGRWIHQEEYGHGFLIAALVAWLLWIRRDALIASVGQPTWVGPIVVFAAATVHIIGELSAIYILSHLAFILALIGITLSVGGYSLLRVTILPLTFLLFAIPLPYFIESLLTWRLQLISSELGVVVIRLMDIPVYLEGNVIDLGDYKLQVVEACSGLRYLYPLLGLSFLAAYFFKAPVWQRTLVFLSAVPITILMNSFRIGMVGVLLHTFGSEMADGALHLFEGWIIFLVCAGLLVGEIYILARLVSGKAFSQVFGVPAVVASSPQPAAHSGYGGAQVHAALLCLSAAFLIVFLVAGRQEIIPERLRFATFPSTLGQWHGQTSLLEQDVERGLGLEDYILADYATPQKLGVNLYVGYYASQRQGLSPHSPMVCMPGGGWRITDFERTSLVSPPDAAMPFNRAVIERGGAKQLVYYWFVQRGRTVSNEFLSKWYLFADAIIKNRTDGALVRVTTPFYPGESDRDADARLRSFVKDLVPHLKDYLPSQSVPDAKSFAYRSNLSHL